MKIAIVVVIILVILYHIGKNETKKEAQKAKADSKSAAPAPDPNTPEYWSQTASKFWMNTREGLDFEADDVLKNNFGKYIAAASTLQREAKLDGVVEIQLYILPPRIVWLLKCEDSTWIRAIDTFDDFKQGFRDCPIFEDCDFDRVIAEFLDRTTSRNGIAAFCTMMKKSLLENKRLIPQTENIPDCCTLRAAVKPAPAKPAPAPESNPNQTPVQPNSRAALEAQMQELLRKRN